MTPRIWLIQSINKYGKAPRHRQDSTIEDPVYIRRKTTLWFIESAPPCTTYLIARTKSARGRARLDSTENIRARLFLCNGYKQGVVDLTMLKMGMCYWFPVCRELIAVCTILSRRESTRRRARVEGVHFVKKLLNSGEYYYNSFRKRRKQVRARGSRELAPRCVVYPVYVCLNCWSLDYTGKPTHNMAASLQELQGSEFLPKRLYSIYFSCSLPPERFVLHGFCFSVAPIYHAKVCGSACSNASPSSSDSETYRRLVAFALTHTNILVSNRTSFQSPRLPLHRMWNPTQLSDHCLFSILIAFSAVEQSRFDFET